MKVLKFGGSSVATADRIKSIGALIGERIDGKEVLTIVFSAFGGVTDQLIEVADLAQKGKPEYENVCRNLRQRHIDAISELIGTESSSLIRDQVNINFDVLQNLLKGVFLVREASLRTMDYILSFGERNSCQIISAYFNSIGIVSNYLDSREIIKTNKEFGSAKVVFDQTTELIEDYYSANSKLNIVTGFVASDVGGLTTTLGRGGSDYTAAILASALDAEALEIWTDVDGVLTSNPKVVAGAYTIPQLSYDEAMELSHFGAKVIYPPTIQPALSKSIPIYIKNTFNPTFSGTLISKEIPAADRRKITGVTAISDVALITLEGSGLMGVPGTAARLFGALGQAKVNIVMISQASSEHSICFAVMTDQVKLSKDTISTEFEREMAAKLINPVNVESDLSLVAVVGEKMKSVPGLAGSLFSSLGRNGINVVAIAQGSSELNITFAIKKEQEHKALNLVHDAFFLSENKTVNVFLVGVGLIGKTLLNQIKLQHEVLIKEKNIDVRVIGISNSRQMYFDIDGIDLENWKELLKNSATKSELGTFIDQLIEFNLPHSLYVDCTANPTTKEHYPRLLSNSISISTANKVAASSDYAEYKQIKDLALKHNAQFLHETNVGAGLPIIRTIEDLVKSGDQVDSIQAVISGSLSYIFNNYAPDKNFKELILSAREKGYTEPDPRDDLSGQDIKRKIIILSRVAGYKIQPEDVSVEAILPQSCLDAPSIDAFFDELEKHDAHFRGLIEKAASQSQKLRYVASFENGKAAINLVYVGEESPFYNLASTDNMVVIKTKRYKERPLVVQGPGAGADVTAAGVFAEIIQLGNSAL